jgi:SRSO17 transposase
LKCVRHFVERSNQDAKSELGWDEFQAQKYRAWEHNLALTILASWFIAQTKYDWSKAHPRDPQLASQMELSFAHLVCCQCA